MTDAEVLRSVAKQVSNAECVLLALSSNWINRPHDGRLSVIQQRLIDCDGDLRNLADKIES